MERALLEALNEARAAKRAVVVAQALDGSGARLIDPEKDEGDPLRAEAVEVLRADKGRTKTRDGTDWFLNPFNPPLRLVIVGAVHISQALAPMAALAGYAVTVVDPREAFASEARFPDVALDPRWPDEALEELRPDARTAVVTLTHDPKLDDPALQAALNSPCFYIAALGSRKTHGARVERLKQAGFDDDAIGRIHGPAGLDIGARSPAEIAVSVMAEMTKTLRTA